MINWEQVMTILVLNKAMTFKNTNNDDNDMYMYMV